MLISTIGAITKQNGQQFLDAIIIIANESQEEVNHIPVMGP